MTDSQLLTSMRLRAEKRLSNYLFVKTLNALIEETKYGRLERPIIMQLIDYCNAYKVSLSGDDMKCLAENRKAIIDDQTRRDRLIKANIIGRGVKI